ncbi:MAG: DUF4250 domain-containing protein [Anaerotruncus sp.]|jgi:hypothetical protein|nr:DUF4250 domain-containing protein [Anaerotruncus sp.]
MQLPKIPSDLLNKVPSDPAILLSFVNTQLRDFYPTLEALCEKFGLDPKELCKKLADIGYHYDKNNNRFSN